MIAINDLILDLSKMVIDQRNAIGEPDANHDYTEALLELAINRAVRDLLSALYEKETPENITKAMPSMVKETGVAMVGGIGTMPPDAYKGLSVKAPIVGGETLCIYIAPEKWYSVQEGYNPEESGTAIYPRWSEFNNEIRLSGLSPASITYLYIKNFETVSIGSDIDINAKFYNQILDLAYAFIMKLTPIQ